MQSDEFEAITNILSKLDKSSFGRDNNSRVQVLNAARTLCARLETPWELVGRKIFIEPLSSAAAKVAIDCGLFRALAGTDEIQGKSAEQLAAATETDVNFLRRMLRILAGTGIIREFASGGGPDGRPMVVKYLPTEFSDTLATDRGSSGISYFFETSLPAYSRLPAYFAHNGYSSPTSDRKSVFQFAQGSTETYWEWLASHPDNWETFNEFMMFGGQARPHWSSTYPEKELDRQIDETEQKEDSVFLVDVGGGSGHDIEYLKRQHPNIPGRLILQDKPDVIREASTKRTFLKELNIETQPHDFFEEQPVKGAKIYLLGSIIHDWPESAGMRILTRIRDAMRPGYSTLLVHDRVMTEIGVDPYTAAADISMMCHFAAGERTEAQWRVLFEKLGMKVENVFINDPKYRGVIEVTCQ